MIVITDDLMFAILFPGMIIAYNVGYFGLRAIIEYLDRRQKVSYSRADRNKGQVESGIHWGSVPVGVGMYIKLENQTRHR